MNTTTTDDSKLVREIRAWLTASRLFYRAYGVKEHLGPEWFVINNLLAGADDGEALVFRDLLNALPAEAQEGSSLNHDLSACLDHLRELKYVDLVEEKEPATLAGRSSFLVSTEIKVREKLLRATRRYIRTLLREFYGLDFAKSYSAKFGDVSKIFYEFGSTTFVEKWAALLRSLVSNSLITGTIARGAFVKEMVGSTEYYILLISLWEIKLLGDDEDGYTEDMLCSVHQFTRYVKESRLRECIDGLVKHGILEEVPHDADDKHYLLADRHTAAFAAFGKHLKSFRDTVRLKIEGGQQNGAS